MVPIGNMHYSIIGVTTVQKVCGGGRSEARRAEARSRRAESGVGFLGRGQPCPPHQLGDLGERCKLPQRGSAPKKMDFDVF